jgi:hypothetical protein
MAGGATQGIQVTVGKDQSTVTIGEDRVEVSADGKKVTAYAGDGVETKCAAGEAAAKGTQFSVSDDFNTVVLNGVTIEHAADGHLVISAPGTVITKPGPANDKVTSEAKAFTSLDELLADPSCREIIARMMGLTTLKAAPEIGDLDDGGIYVGLSAENGKPLHAALADLPDYKAYKEALAAAEQLKAAHPTAHVPTPKELDKNLYDNRNTGHLKGTFNTSGSNPGSVYRSSASYLSDTARVQWFGDGSQGDHFRDVRLPVRLVW